MKMYICGRYNPGGLVEKQRLITANVEASESNTDANNFFWTFTSGYMTLWYTPKGMAAALKPWIMDTFKKNGKSKGVVVVDFVDKMIAGFLVSTNFPVTDGYTGKCGGLWGFYFSVYSFG